MQAMQSSYYNSFDLIPANIRDAAKELIENELALQDGKFKWVCIYERDAAYMIVAIDLDCNGGIGYVLPCHPEAEGKIFAQFKDAEKFMYDWG